MTGPGTIAEGGSGDICVRLERPDGTSFFLDRFLTVFLSTTNGKAGMTFMHFGSKGSLRDKYMYIQIHIYVHVVINVHSI